MKTDTYTKAILTIIALCLIVIVLRDIPFTTPARAQSFGTASALDVRVVNTPEVRIATPYEGLDVRIKNAVQLDIPYRGIDVNVKNPVALDIPYGGIKVDVQ